MLKRKLITLGRRRARNEEEESDSSESCRMIRKRFRPNISKESIHEQRVSVSDADQANSSLSSDEDENNLFFSNPMHSTLDLPSDHDTGPNCEENVNNDNQYDGYQSFKNSFQFFSDESDSQSYESDSQVTPKYIKKEKNTSKIKEKNKRKNVFRVESSDKDHLRKLSLSDNVRVIGYYLENLELVFMEHPSSVPIIGYLTVTLIAGKASIQGYALEVNKPVTVFSQKQTGILEVRSHYCEELELCMMQSKARKVLQSKFMKNVPADEIKNLLRENVKYSTTLFILQSRVLSPGLQFLSLYSPFATSFDKRSKRAITQYVASIENEENVLKFGQEYDEIFTTMHKHVLKTNRRRPGQPKSEAMEGSSSEDDFCQVNIKPGQPKLETMEESSSEEDVKSESDSKKLTGFRILISGPKKVGKSTMLRYLVNSFLNKYPEVYYLDTDCGQTEFTPPGAISLVKVTKPIFGPPYSHLRKPLKSIYTGSITPESSPPMYMKSISKMISCFNKYYPDSILVVNTLGWLTGTGDVVLQHLRKALSAVVEIHVEPGFTPLNISIEDRILSCTVGFERNAASSTKQGDNRPADLRDYTVLAYLGQCLPYFMPTQTLNGIRPFCICWDNIPVYNFSKRLMFNRYYEALINTLVALCRVKKSYILSPVTNPDYPLTLEDEPINDCLGYGFVRAVDEEKHLLYIVTPLNLDTLTLEVNAILCGNILVPRSVILEQDIYDVELDFTDKSKEGKTELRKPIRKRERGISSNERSFYSH